MPQSEAWRPTSFSKCHQWLYQNGKHENIWHDIGQKDGWSTILHSCWSFNGPGKNIYTVQMEITSFKGVPSQTNPLFVESTWIFGRASTAVHSLPHMSAKITIDGLLETWQVSIEDTKTVLTPKLTELAGISRFSIGNTSSIRVHFPASYVGLPECNTYAVECVEKCSFMSIPHDKKLQELTESLSKIILTMQQTQNKTEQNTRQQHPHFKIQSKHNETPQFRISENKTKQSKKASLPQEVNMKAFISGWVTKVDIRGPLSSMILHPLAMRHVSHNFTRFNQAPTKTQWRACPYYYT